MEPISYDPIQVTQCKDPYPIYARLRREDPIHWSPSARAWIISRHQDVMSLLKDSRWSSDHSISAEGPEPGPRQNRLLLFLDGPEHAALRRSVARALHTEISAAHADFTRAAARLLLKSASQQGSADLVAEYAKWLPLYTLGHLIGMPEDEIKNLMPYATALCTLLAWMPRAAPLQDAEAQAAKLIPVIAHALRIKRRSPASDVLSSLIADVRKRELQYADVIASIILLFAAGYSTSSHMVGTAVFHMLTHPHLRAAYQSGACTMRQLVDELLRFDGPVHATPRTALEDITVGGRRVSRGETALALLASANRDPEAFSDPDLLLPTRKNTTALALGAGVHVCVGAAVGRLTVTVALEEVMPFLPDMRLLENDPIWTGGLTQRGLSRLQVALDRPREPAHPET